MFELAPYRYAPLLESQIRLLTILPGSLYQDLECRLSHVDHDQTSSKGQKNANPSYKALSYVWGDPKAVSWIILDDVLVGVTKDLHHALRHLRHASEPRQFWVDALCINQNDVLEKTEQIKKMKQIYSQADQVIMWLGEAAFEDNWGIRWAMGYLIELQECWLDKKTGYKVVCKTSITTKLDELQDQYKLHNEANALQALFEREYWHRVWILQECLVARDAVVMWGDLVIEWSFLRRLLQYWKEHVPWTSAHFIERSQIIPDEVVHLGDLSVRRDRGKRIGLLDALLLSRERKCTKRVDKVFGVLGFVTDRGRHLEVNYQESVEAVLLRVARHFIEKHQSLDFLSACKSAEQKTTENLPSWIPDWTSASNETAPVSYLLFSHPRPVCYNAANSTEPTAYYLDDGPRLIVSGQFFDKIAVTIQRAFLWDFQTLWGVWNDYLSSKALQSPYGDKEQGQKALRATGILGRNERGDEEDFSDKDFYSWFWASVGAERKDENAPDINPQIYKDYQARFHILSGCLFYPGQFFITEQGYLGRGSSNVTEGDKVCILFGARVPFVLRQKEEKWEGQEQYCFHGECYVQGIMKGEALMDNQPSETFILC